MNFPVVGGLYRHYEHPKRVYRVIAIAEHKRHKESVIVYKNVTPKDAPEAYACEMWACDILDWLGENPPMPPGTPVGTPRFTRAPDDTPTCDAANAVVIPAGVPVVLPAGLIQAREPMLGPMLAAPSYVPFETTNDVRLLEAQAVRNEVLAAADTPSPLLMAGVPPGPHDCPGGDSHHYESNCKVCGRRL